MTIVTRQTANRPMQYLSRVTGTHTSPITVWNCDRSAACDLSDDEAQRLAAMCKDRSRTAAHHSSAKREPEGDYGVEQ